MSNYSPGNAPPGKTSLLCEVTLRSDEPVPGADLERQVVSGLEQAGLLRRGEVLFTDRSYSRHAYILFDLRFDERRARVLEWVHGAGFETHGRFGRYDYDNSDVCVIKSRALAQKLLRHAAAG
jgi:protoporphyrinogen oxidase